METGECKDDAVDCAFRFAWWVSQARRLRGKAGNCGKKIVRELGLAAFKKQHELQVPWFRTVFDKELADRLIAAGFLGENGSESAGGERAGAGVAAGTEGSARWEADTGAGSAACSVLVSAEEVQGGPVLRSRSVLGMGGGGGGRGDTEGERPPPPGGTGGGGASKVQAEGVAVMEAWNVTVEGRVLRSLRDAALQTGEMTTPEEAVQVTAGVMLRG